jgi:hypothetical protein
MLRSSSFATCFTTCFATSWSSNELALRAANFELVRHEWGNVTLWPDIYYYVPSDSVKL